jgi:hypothetical protein
MSRLLGDINAAQRADSVGGGTGPDADRRWDGVGGGTRRYGGVDGMGFIRG